MVRAWSLQVIDGQAVRAPEDFKSRRKSALGETAYALPRGCLTFVPSLLAAGRTAGRFS